MEYDVVIIGAGVAGISALYHIKKQHPQLTAIVLESKNKIGGTWNKFNYPGAMSDTAMYSYSFSFKNFTGRKYATTQEIQEYVEATVDEFDLMQYVQLNTTVTKAAWTDQQWTITTDKETLTAKWIYFATGYFDHSKGYTPDIPGQDVYSGIQIHSQDCNGTEMFNDKRVAVIGSGATACSMIPALASVADRVMWIRRTPGYIAELPQEDIDQDDYEAQREQNINARSEFYQSCVDAPATAKYALLQNLQEHLGTSTVDDHFTPSYNPWDQRFCADIDGKLISTIQHGLVDIYTTDSIRLSEYAVVANDQTIEADVIVYATGFNISTMGKITVTVNDEVVLPCDQFLHTGSFMSGLPNLVSVVGYGVDAWTLKAELTAEYFCRLLTYMSEHNYTVMTPVAPNEEGKPALPFQAGYLLRGKEHFPKVTDTAPWNLAMNHPANKEYIESITFNEDFFSYR